jgi:two-component system, NarL family, sensor histidine kinase UhpB
VFLLRLSSIRLVKKNHIIPNLKKLKPIMKKALFTFQFYTILAYICFLALGNILFYYSSYFSGVDNIQNNHQRFFMQSLFFIISAIIFILITNYFYSKNLQKSFANATATIDRYEALGNATNDAIWDYDMKTEKIFYNERLVSIFGYSKEELNDNTNWWENNIHEVDKDRVLKRMNNLLERNKTSWEDEYLFRCKNGEYKIVYDRSYIIRDNAGKPIRLIGAMKDVTRLRSLEKELISKQLKEKNKIGKTIIVAHEKERKKVKDQLHEDVNQLLASIKIFISRNKAELESDNIKMSLGYLDDVMMKINNISNGLLSSTFDLFGLVDGVNELLDKYENSTALDLKFDSKNFNEEKVDKNLALHLFRIIEDRLTIITENISTDKIEISISNDTRRATLNIEFRSYMKNIESILNNDTAIEINSKLEMYEGKMKLNSSGDNYYAIVAIVA